MGSFRLINSEVKALTPEFAKQFRELEPSPTERELIPGRVKHLREKAEAGQLVTFSWSTAKLGSKRYRMNGMHSSTMLCDLDGNFPDGLKVHLDDYEVQDKNGLAVLFRQFDDRKSGRSAADVSGAYQGLFESLSGVPRPIAKLGIEGVAWFRHTIEGAPIKSDDSRYEMFAESGLHPFLQWIGEILDKQTPEMKVREVIAAMYVSFMANETEARKFWLDVARGGDDYDDGSPAAVLDNWLKALREEKDPTVKAAGYYQGSVFAWNAYREGKPIRAIKTVFKGWLKPVI